MNLIRVQYDFFKTFFSSRRFYQIFIAIIFLGTIHSYAQNSQVDSLNRLIAKATTDTAKINLANKKITILSRINIDTAINAAQQTIEEAKKINYKKGEADALLQLATSYCNKGKFEEAHAALETSQGIFKQLKDSAGFGKMYS